MMMSNLQRIALSTVIKCTDMAEAVKFTSFVIHNIFPDKSLEVVLY